MKTLEKKSKKIIFFLNFYGIQVALVWPKGKMDGGEEREEMWKKDVRFSFCCLLESYSWWGTRHDLTI